MATRLKNVDEIVSADHGSGAKTTVLDYTPVAANTGAIDLSAGNNFTVAGGTGTLSFSNTADHIGQSGNIYVTGGASIDTNSVISKGDITGDHWVSYFVVNATHAVISIGEDLS